MPDYAQQETRKKNNEPATLLMVREPRLTAGARSQARYHPERRHQRHPALRVRLAQRLDHGHHRSVDALARLRGRLEERLAPELERERGTVVRGDLARGRVVALRPDEHEHAARVHVHVEWDLAACARDVLEGGAGGGGVHEDDAVAEARVERVRCAVSVKHAWVYGRYFIAYVRV